MCQGVSSPRSRRAMCRQSSSRNVGAMCNGVGSPRDRRAMCMLASSRNVRATCKDVGPPRDSHAICMRGSSRNLRAVCKGVGSPRKRRALCLQDSSRNVVRCRRVVGSPRNSRAMCKARHGTFVRWANTVAHRSLDMWPRMVVACGQKAKQASLRHQVFWWTRPGWAGGLPLEKAPRYGNPITIPLVG